LDHPRSLTELISTLKHPIKLREHPENLQHLSMPLSPTDFEATIRPQVEATTYLHRLNAFIPMPCLDQMDQKLELCLPLLMLTGLTFSSTTMDSIDAMGATLVEPITPIALHNGQVGQQANKVLS